MIVPDQMQKRDAGIAYDMGNYEVVYDLLYGKDLNEEEEIILHKSTIIMKMERKINSYQNYLKMSGKELEALNALVQGVALYYELQQEADEYHVLGEIGDKYQQILAILSDQYGLSEADVMDIISSEDDIVYTQKITAVLSGATMPADAEQSDGIADVLPEEQEILDGLSENTENTADMEADDIPDAPSDDALNAPTDEAMNAPADDVSNETAADENVDSEGEINYIEPVSVEVHQNN